ncbi:family 16 glycoside hydrolase [Chitinophaga vietnamensis]|uniref:family 16 glycoside hydrolase n=1 Tax=Chitinophaga vietnamensis TaxID=2593957 RepID=UPI00191C40A1|nr:family 16 glycoside hydrolase [Chitinophaga vietnamensis]
MKKILYLIIAALLATPAFLYAQGPADQRAFHTKVADVLALMPANNQSQLNTNMETIAGLGEDGLVAIAGMLAAPGKGDNTQLQYALAGYAFYVTQPGKEKLRQTAVAALCKALPKATDVVNKTFLITLLQTVGDNNAVSTLQPYLSDEQLCDPAARALVKINTPAARQALLQALSAASGNRRLTLVEALGDSKTTEAAAAIAALAVNADPKVAKVALYALAHIGQPASATILSNAAAKAGFKYDVTNASAVYLTYISELNNNGNKALADKLAAALLQQCKQENQLHTRTAALALLSDIRGDKSAPLLMQAAANPQAQYRDAALKLLGKYINNLDVTQLNQAQEVLRKADNGGKAAMLAMLGDNKVLSALPAMYVYMKDKDEAVRTAAIAAAGKTGGVAALPELLKAMKTGDQHTIAAVKNALLIMPGGEVTEQAGASLAAMPPAAQAALITVLAARKADTRIQDVLPLTGSKDAAVHDAAMAALPEMATRANLPQLFTLLNSANDATDIRHLQSAIINTHVATPDVLAQMQATPADKQYRFFAVLAGLGDKSALAPVVNAFDNGDVQTKTAAIRALSDWKDASAAPALLQIARNKNNSSYLESALLGYTGLATHSGYPADQRLLMLRDAMELATTANVQQQILKAVEKCKTFPALLFAGNYLDNTALQQDAAMAVMNIALADKSYNGAQVRALLEKAAQALKGGDADYQRQSIRKYLAEMPAGEGFVSLFNGKDLSGWKGLVANPIERAKMDAKAMAKAQAKADEIMRKGWSVKDGLLIFNGEGDNLCTEKKYGDFEMLVDWKIQNKGDAGIYLRGSPQVQIWDTSRVDVGAQVGSGGLYNNQQHESKPLVLADNAIGEWNHFHIIMKGDHVTVYLNGKLVTDNTILENYWNRNLPIFPEEQIELQAHGSYVAYRDLMVKELTSVKPYDISEEEKKAGYRVLFDGTNMHNWTGNTKDYVIDNGDLVIIPTNGGHGNLYTKEEFKNFSFRFDFMLTPGANNGLGVRAPLEGDAAYVGMELQILDNEADIYKNLNAYQYHGSVYGVIPAKRGYLKPVGEWNTEEAIVDGTHIKVILNGTVILDGDIAEARKNGAMDHKEHPGLKNETGHIGFLGHGSLVRFRHMRVKTL